MEDYRDGVVIEGDFSANSTKKESAKTDQRGRICMQECASNLQQRRYSYV